MSTSHAKQEAAHLRRLLSAKDPAHVQQSLALIEALADPAVYAELLRGSAVSAGGELEPGVDLPGGYTIFLALLAAAPDDCPAPVIQRREALTKLQLSGLALDALPAAFSRLTALEELDLTDNALTAESLAPMLTALAGLPALRSLDLGFNQLAALPAEIGELTGLQELGLYENRLAALPLEFARLRSLEQLHLFRNRLRALPPMLVAMPRLREVDLSWNPLTSRAAGQAQIDALRGMGVEVTC